MICKNVPQQACEGAQFGGKPDQSQACEKCRSICPNRGSTRNIPAPTALLTTLLLRMRNRNRKSLHPDNQESKFERGGEKSASIGATHHSGVNMLGVR